MSAAGDRRSTIVLYSDDLDPDSHRVRLVLAEKGLRARVVTVDPDGLPPSGLRESGARGELPVLIDRDLTLHGVHVIVDYLDERYPHPPFMPMDPISRARTRLALHRIERDWYALAPRERSDAAMRRADAERLLAALDESDEVFAAMPYFLSDSYSVLDAALAPLLWRLPHYGIVLPETASSVAAYARRMFVRPAFRASLSVREQEMAR